MTSASDKNDKESSLGLKMRHSNNLPPENGKPTRFSERIMGREALRWSQDAMLSPVQMGPCSKREIKTANNQEFYNCCWERLKFKHFGISSAGWILSVFPRITSNYSYEPSDFFRFSPSHHRMKSSVKSTLWIPYSPCLWVPAKNALERTKGLWVPPERSISPWTVAMCW